MLQGYSARHLARIMGQFIGHHGPVDLFVRELHWRRWWCIGAQYFSE